MNTNNLIPSNWEIKNGYNQIVIRADLNEFAKILEFVEFNEPTDRVQKNGHDRFQGAYLEKKKITFSAPTRARERKEGEYIVECSRILEHISGPRGVLEYPGAWIPTRTVSSPDYGLEIVICNTMEKSVVL
jgi:hypothetical protein